MLQLKIAQMECEEYILKDEFAKAIISVAGKQFKDYFEKKKLPGSSPVLEMING